MIRSPMQGHASRGLSCGQRLRALPIRRSLDRRALHPHTLAWPARGPANDFGRQPRRRCSRRGGRCDRRRNRKHGPRPRRGQSRRGAGHRLGRCPRRHNRQHPLLLDGFDNRRSGDHHGLRLLGRRTPGRQRGQPREGLHGRSRDRLCGRHRLHAAGKCNAEKAQSCAVRDRQHLRRSCCGLIASSGIVPAPPRPSQPSVASAASRAVNGMTRRRRRHDNAMRAGRDRSAHSSFVGKWIPACAPMI